MLGSVSRLVSSALKTLKISARGLLKESEVAEAPFGDVVVS